MLLLLAAFKYISNELELGLQVLRKQYLMHHVHPADVSKGLVDFKVVLWNILVLVGRKLLAVTY